jgi:hypothetical protein
MKNDRIKNDRIKSDRMKNDRIKSDRIKTDRIKTDRIKTDRIKTDRIKSITDPFNGTWYRIFVQRHHKIACKCRPATYFIKFSAVTIYRGNIRSKKYIKHLFRNYLILTQWLLYTGIKLQIYVLSDFLKCSNGIITAAPSWKNFWAAWI